MIGKKYKFPRIPLVALLLIPSIILNIILIARSSTHEDSGITVIGVIDGDTVVLEGKSRVRLRQVDAPDDPNCGSKQAAETLEQLAMGKKVRLDELIPDQYGRGMGLVYVGNTLINREMIASGWVRYHHDSTSQTENLEQASELAKTEKLGIYGACQSTVNAEKTTCNIKGNIDKSTDTHIYYTPGCAQYEFTLVELDLAEQWFCTEKEAQQAGYTKAKTCVD